MEYVLSVKPNALKSILPILDSGASKVVEVANEGFFDVKHPNVLKEGVLLEGLGVLKGLVSDCINVEAPLLRREVGFDVVLAIARDGAPVSDVVGLYPNSETLAVDFVVVAELSEAGGGAA